MHQTWKVRDDGRTAGFTEMKYDATVGIKPIIGR
jgi:hypothetical protein